MAVVESESASLTTRKTGLVFQGCGGYAREREREREREERIDAGYEVSRYAMICT